MSWLSIVGDKPPQNTVAETVLLLFASSLFFNLGWAQLSSVAVLSLVLAVWSAGCPKTLGWLGFSQQVPKPFLLCAMAPGGPTSREAGPLTWQLRAPKGIKQ